MPNREKIQSIVLTALTEIYTQVHRGNSLTPTEETVLFGRSGVLDSLGLVNLVVEVEQKIEEEFQVTLTLADEKAISQRHSPFRTVATFVDYVTQRLAENGNG